MQLSQLYPLGYIRKKTARGWAIFIVGGGEPSKDDGARTDIFRPPPAYGQLRNTENRQRLRGLATAALMSPLRLIAVPPCSFPSLPNMDFTAARSLTAYQQPPVEDYADLLVPHCIGIDFALLGLTVFLFVFQ